MIKQKVRRIYVLKYSLLRPQIKTPVYTEQL